MTRRTRALLPAAVVCIAALGVALGAAAASGRSAGLGAPTPSTTVATLPNGSVVTAPSSTTPDDNGLIAGGVSIGGVSVGGLSEARAASAVFNAYTSAVPIAFGGHVFRATARQLGFHVYLGTPLRRAWAIGRTTDVQAVDIPVVTRLAGGGLRHYVDYLARTFDRPVSNARIELAGTQPQVVPDVWGRAIDKAATTQALLSSLRNPARPLVRPVSTALRPSVVARSVGPAIVIDRGLHRLTLYDGATLVRSFGVAVGQPIYPTPTGAFHIIVKEENPWWYPPQDAAWARGLQPVPPGPGNPLGTRWMGISSPGVGIHGTPDAASIGYSASHGCIRMQIPDAEWLFGHVAVGTPVWIID
jgi:lipoprotein-anchoring transpeptidase ErfK/SrfK